MHQFLVVRHMGFTNVEYPYRFFDSWESTKEYLESIWNAQIEFDIENNCDDFYEDGNELKLTSDIEYVFDLKLGADIKDKIVVKCKVKVQKDINVNISSEHD